ncbi:MAG: chemotaxis protein CheA, partial [Moraxellaceae bacterium]
KGELNATAIERENNLRARLHAYEKHDSISSAQSSYTASSSSSVGGAVTSTEKFAEKISDERTVTSDLWHISLRFGVDVYKNGMDPSSFLRYLATVGQIINITTLSDTLPAAATMDAELCYLGFELDLQSNADKAAIASVFDFVSDDCVIHILPPHSKVEEYLQMISALPESDTRLGELLVNSGALTPQELEEGLLQQKHRAESSGQPAFLGEILIEQRSVEPELIQAALDKQTQISDKKNKESHFIRVQADKLDALINLVGELVIAGAGASLLAQKSKQSDFFEATSRVTELVEQIRDGALRMRMVPVGDTFNRFQRVVRDVSQELGKDIELKITGGDTEVDKTVVEKISDPLMHLLRNSMDHGIESPERRLAAGKPARGTLSLNAYHDSGSIVIEIIDDGGGLNRERILKKAIERELIPSGANLSDHEIYQLIFEPGFSTAEAVTNLSGRGVGMDVVKRNIAALRGSIELDSQAGVGTSVRIRLPLTLAIIDGFLVGVGQTSYIVPLDMVQECLELTESERQEARFRNYLNLRGEVLP